MHGDKISCFTGYDVRGIVGETFNGEVAYKIGRALVDHLNVKNLVIGYDARRTSPEIAMALERSATDASANALKLGLAGTEEVCWAVNSLGACAGIQVTASHNPENYNGLKFIKSGSIPLDIKSDMVEIHRISERGEFRKGLPPGSVVDVSRKARVSYTEKIVKFFDFKSCKALRIVTNSGNGAAGPTLDRIIKRIDRLGAKLDFVRILHEPDPSFPKGVPNPMLATQHQETKNAILEHQADFGVAFDGDFDRCVFFDENGNYISSEYIIGELARLFLAESPNSTIVHDNRAIWNIQDVVSQSGGEAVLSKTGHALVKRKMRDVDAVYGGEKSAHHYFRDFAYSDSGMIPWILMVKILSESNLKLSELVADRKNRFPSSAELNFFTGKPDSIVQSIVSYLGEKALKEENYDGLTYDFDGWRLNLRKSNTEPAVRLNLEGQGGAVNLQSKISLLKNIIASQN